MREKVNLIKTASEYVLAFPAGKKLSKGDFTISVSGLISKISSVVERDYFDGTFYYLEDGICLGNPIKIVGFESDIEPDLISKIKELKEVPLYIEIVENQIVLESGKIKIIY